MYEKYADMLVRGLKTRELRSYRTHIRGPVAILSKSRVLGIVRIKEVLGPFVEEELEAFYEFHRVEGEKLREMFRGKHIRARVVEPIVRFERPIKIAIKRGARIRARVEIPDSYIDKEIL